jgi:SSS family solute:Na+ symporter
MPPAFNVFLGPLGALFLIGMFQPRATAPIACLSVLSAMAVSFVWNYDTLLFGKQYDLSLCGAIAIPCTFGFVLAAILSLAAGSGDHPGQRFTWWEVMKRPLPTNDK